MAPHKLKIVADESIAHVRDVFRTLGHVKAIPGREIDAHFLRDADVLLVRSVTRVDSELLGKSRVSFVGSATSGIDHIDTAHLHSAGIRFEYAPGSNANSVAEYVLAALVVLSEKLGRDIERARLGIVGLGQVGRRVHEKARAIGMNCTVNDPPLARGSRAPLFRPIEEVLECDFITLHVPLVRVGSDPTFHLVDEDFLDKLSARAVLINTSRGPVVNGDALKSALTEERIAGAVLDVWEHEPEIDVELLERVDIATPHIAGYSLDGKVEGTRMLYESACRYFGAQQEFDFASLLKKGSGGEITVEDTSVSSLFRAICAIYDIMSDDARMRAMTAAEPKERRRIFDELRGNYPERRELGGVRVRAGSINRDAVRRWSSIGFTLVAPANSG